MITKKEIKFRVNKPINYNPISKVKKEGDGLPKLGKLRQLFRIAERYDGTPSIRLTFNAKGNI